MYETVDQNLTDSNVGCRKGRNIRDNIFICSAIANSVMKKESGQVDFHIRDVETCFDKLDLKECIMDLYDAGIDNDKLNLLYLENKNCQVSIKVNQSSTKRINLSDIVLQGTLWAGLMCTTQMDKFAKDAYKSGDTYSYKQKVEVAALEMVDDILVPINCGQESAKLNAKVNSFIESKKLKLSCKKCHKMHLGKKTLLCPKLKVHDENMEDSSQEKYLGDILVDDGKILKTVEDRCAKGFGLVSQIMAILSEVPLGKYKIQMGLHLRQAMLLNGMLYNSEAWHCLNNEHIKMLEEVDNHFLRSLFKSHSKTSTSFLHLETATLPIKFIIASRRLNYLHNILKRNKRVARADFGTPVNIIGLMIDDTFVSYTVRSDFVGAYRKSNFYK